MEQHIISEFSGKQVKFNHVIWRETRDEFFDIHCHDVYEIIFVKSGKVSGIVGPKAYKLYKNSLILFRPYSQHSILLGDSDDYERYDILFDASGLSVNADERIPKDLDVMNFGTNKIISGLFSKLDYYYKLLEEEDFAILLKNIVEEIIVNLSLAKDKNYNNDVGDLSLVLKRAIEYIDEYYTTTVTLGEICDYLFVTKSHLHHLFMEHMGISPKRYINIRRLTEAQKLIRMGERPTEVYLSCGFSDYATFFRNYKKHFGHGPKDERDLKIDRVIFS